MNADRAEQLHAAIVARIVRLVEDTGRTRSDIAVDAGIGRVRFAALLDHRAVFALPELAQVGRVLGFLPSEVVEVAERGLDAVTDAAQVRAWVTGALGDDADEQHVDRIVRFLLANGVAAR